MPVDLATAGTGIAAFLGGLATFWTVSAENRRRARKALDEEREEQKAEHKARMAILEEERKAAAARPALPGGGVDMAKIREEMAAVARKQWDARHAEMALKSEVERLRKQNEELLGKLVTTVRDRLESE